MGIWFAIILVTLVVVGSVVWIRPSPRDQKLAKWRRDAIVAGMKVRMQTLKAEPKNSGIRDDVSGVTYEWFNPQSDKKDTSSWAVVKTQGWLTDHLPEGWSWYNEIPANVEAQKINEIINAAPYALNALERTPISSRIIWDENGAEFDAQVLKAYLQQLQAIS
ncbi:MAG: hypothetical protein HWE18_10090 [Gammaproteobacteria bacterium]|nr:hypothetical protein [Gammaproteobacteria bacterium]